MNDEWTNLRSTQIWNKVANVYLPRVGRVWITKYKGKYYCANRCPNYQKQLYEWYAERWCVEMVFRFIKSELKMQDCQVGYCFLVYGILQVAFPNINPYEAKRKIESMYIVKTISLKPQAFKMGS